MAVERGYAPVVIPVPSVLDRVDNVVRLEGQVWREGSVKFRPGMRLTDLIPSLDDVRRMPDQNYVPIRRELPPATPGSDGDIILEDGDVLMVPGPMRTVTVLGEVQSPTSTLFERALGRED
jgi:protein involved in polysaccharide export with SLBB domain